MLKTKKPHRLRIGATFNTVTKQMMKTREQSSTGKNTYEVLKPGEIRSFIKGKRMYSCEVLGIVEFRTGCYVVHATGYNKADYNRMSKWARWYQFTYLVRVLNN